MSRKKKVDMSNVKIDKVIPKEKDPYQCVPTKKSKFKEFVRKFIRPFWFSANCEILKVPYFYGNMLMILLFTSVIIFLGLVIAGKTAAASLGVFAGVITTLAGLYFGTLKLYNNGVSVKQENKTKVNNVQID